MSPPRKGGKGQSGGDTAQRIAAAALAILEAEGPEKVTMRRVAATLGITPMAIYYHFPDRHALLQSLVYGELDTLAALARRIDETRTGKDRLVRIFDAYLDYAI